MTEAERQAIIDERAALEAQMRGIMRSNAYFGSHNGYVAASRRVVEINYALNGIAAKAKRC